MPLPFHLVTQLRQRLRLDRLSAAQRGMAAALVTICAWTAFIVVSRASASHTLAPFDLALLRYLGAGLVLLPWGWWLSAQQRARGDHSGSLAGLSPLPLGLTVFLGMTGGVLFTGLSFSGFFIAPAAHASVLMPGSMPLWATLLAWIWLHERVGPLRALGLLLILLGDALVGGASLLQAFDGGTVWRGDLCFMGASLGWSFYSLALKKHQVDPVRGTIATTVFALLVLLPAYALLVATGVVESRMALASVWELLFQAGFQGMVAVVVSGLAYTHMVRYYGPVRSSMITSVVPVSSALAAVALLGEPLRAHLIGGLCLVTMGIMAGVWAATAPAKEAR